MRLTILSSNKVTSQGTVNLAFTITTEATIQDIIVTQGVDISLDKEAVRVIRALKLSNPALLNGKPQEVCITLPVRFKLN
jgi:TonB family protein